MLFTFGEKQTREKGQNNLIQLIEHTNTYNHNHTLLDTYYYYCSPWRSGTPAGLGHLAAESTEISQPSCVKVESV